MVSWTLVLELIVKWAIPAICVALVGFFISRIIKPIQKQNAADRQAQWDECMQNSKIPETYCNKTYDKLKAESDTKDQEILTTINNLAKTIEKENEETRLYRKTTDKQIELIQEGVRDVHLQNLIKTCEKYIKRGYITPEEREIYNQRYNLYKSLGGNGHMEPWDKQITKLPSEIQKSNEYVVHHSQVPPTTHK